MAQYTIRIDDAVAATVGETARRRNVSEEQCATQILVAYHDEFRRFPDGVLREGCQKLIAVLSQIPCLAKFDSSGIDFRYWRVSFELDTFRVRPFQQWYCWAKSQSAIRYTEISMNPIFAI